MAIPKVTDSNSKEFLESNKNSFLVLFFDAKFSGQSNIVENAIQALSASDLKEKIVLAEIDVEESNNLALELNIEAVPLVACMFKSKIVKRIDILEPTKLITLVNEELKKHSLLHVAGGEETTIDPKEKFKDYLKQLVNKSPIMIFMKGEPKQPRCGFSKQLVELLGKYDIKYDTFDILLDEEVRQGLKEYSDWPTYPQIYVKGEFIGGLDILRQLDEQGELQSTLKA